MKAVSFACSLSLALAFTTTAMAAERQEVRRARGMVARSDPALGSIRLEFRTLAPGPNTDAIAGTVQIDPAAPGLFHRILMDTDRGLYYGYDLELSKGGDPGRFTVAVRPLAASVEQEFRQRLWNDFCHECQAPRPVNATSQRYPGPRAVAAGDVLAIDLLADERSGELITDRVAFLVPHRAPRSLETLPPRDLKAEDVLLQMAEAKLRVNGRPAWPASPGEPAEEGVEEGGGSVQGEVVWAEIPGHGRVFLSLAPRPGYDFKKIGVVSGDRISFTIDGDRYEWISRGPIATSGPVAPFSNVQSWYVWVLHDPDYQPVAGRSGGVGAGFDERARNRLKRQ